MDIQDPEEYLYSNTDDDEAEVPPKAKPKKEDVGLVRFQSKAMMISLPQIFHVMLRLKNSRQPINRQHRKIFFVKFL